jgi:hypothetical protein
MQRSVGSITSWPASPSTVQQRLRDLFAIETGGEKPGQADSQRNLADAALGGTDGQNNQSLLLGSIAGDRPGSRFRCAHVRFHEGLSIGYNVHRPDPSSVAGADQADCFVGITCKLLESRGLR